jgi:hypothetical protein
MLVNSGSATLAAGVVTIPNASGDETLNYWDITEVTKTCAATAVAQVDHFTPSGFTVGTCCGEQATYEIKLYNPTCLNEMDVAPKNYSITFSEDVTGAEIVDSFISLINGDSDSFVTASDGANTLILTAKTAGCRYDVLFVSDNIAHINFVANVVPFGTPTQVEEFIDSTYVTAGAYHGITIKRREFLDNTDQCTECKTVCIKTCLIWYADNASGDSFVSTLNTITTGGSTAALYFAKSGTITGC